MNWPDRAAMCCRGTSAKRRLARSSASAPGVEHSGCPRAAVDGRRQCDDAGCALYGTDGKWDVENYGVAPDIEIEFDPAAWRAGRDPQLEKAVEVLLAEIKKNPLKPTPRPAAPNYHKDGKSVVGGDGTSGKRIEK